MKHKAFLFNKTVLDADASTLLALIETCNAIEIDPLIYINQVFLNLENTQTDEESTSNLPFSVDFIETKTYIDINNAAILFQIKLISIYFVAINNR